MATSTNALLQQYNEYYKANKVEVDTWPLLGNPLPLICIITVYLLFVLKLGPWLMATRKPFILRETLIVYNLLVVLVSIVLTIWPIVKDIIPFLYRESCHPRNGVPYSMSYGAASYTWYYFMSKILELFDTIFFVLRKKYNQISFLHVYHHTTVMVCSFIHLQYLPGVQGTIVGFLNSGVHIFMYFYYMLAAMGPSYYKYLWWKKYMTWMQLVQFLTMGTYMSGLLIFNCELPKPVSVFFIIISIIFLALFADFYSKTYKKKEK